MRFIKVLISNESLVPATTTHRSGTFQQDLDQFVSDLEDNTPAYILARTDKPGSEWLMIFYIPDTSKVRDKVSLNKLIESDNLLKRPLQMLYASTRNSVMKLGSNHFTDTMTATSKRDVTGEAYARHLRDLAAPKPMSQREKVLAEMAEAEKKAADDYQGTNTRTSHLSGAVVGFAWAPEVEEAFKKLAVEELSRLLVVVSTTVVLDDLVHGRSPQTVETPGEKLKLVSFEEATANQVGLKLPPSEPGGYAVGQCTSPANPTFLPKCLLSLVGTIT